jgi:hypothetical protein
MVPAEKEICSAVSIAPNVTRRLYEPPPAPRRHTKEHSDEGHGDREGNEEQ